MNLDPVLNPRRHVC